MSEALQAAEAMIGRAMDVAARIIRRGIVKLTSDDYFQQIEGFANPDDVPETFNGVELWQHFGFTSRPPAESEALIAKVDGDAEQPICFATQNRSERPAISSGDSAIYSEKTGSDQAIVKPRADLDVDVVPGPTQFANVGGAKGDAALELALLGASFTTRLTTLNTTLTAVPNATDLATAITLVNAIKAELLTLSATATSLLAARAKVK